MLEKELIMSKKTGDNFGFKKPNFGFKKPKGIIGLDSNGRVKDTQKILKQLPLPDITVTDPPL
jgi:hypothetical protein